MTSFGEKLKALRKERGLSQAHFARELGISQTYLSALENRDKAPRQETTEQLAFACDVPMTYFFNEPLGAVDRTRKIEGAKIYLRELAAMDFVVVQPRTEADAGDDFLWEA